MSFEFLYSSTFVEEFGSSAPSFVNLNKIIKSNDIWLNLS